MMLIEQTTVPLEALPVQDFKDHLHLGSGFADDALQDSVLEGYLRAALAALEARIGKAILSRQFTWTVTQWSERGDIVLPIAPIVQITELRLERPDGGSNTAELSSFRLIADTHSPRLAARTSALPTIPGNGQAVITFTAGYGATWPLVPADLRQAVLLLAAQYYEHRTETAQVGGEMPYGVAVLIECYRSIRISGGGRS